MTKEILFTHVTRDEGEERYHISHLHHYVSAYEYTKETLKDLVDDLERALEEAKKKTETIIVDQDGEMFFCVYPSGLISLCFRWKNYKVIRE